MKILIADDEMPARERLRSLIEEIGRPYQVVAEAENGVDALNRCEEASVDLVMLDIRMPGMDGLEAARRLARAEHPPAVVFTTAYDEHALEAFDRNAVDYLLKPIRIERLKKALSRAQALTRAQLQILDLAKEREKDADRHICAHYRGGLQAIPIAEVFCFRADQKYVTARHIGGEVLLEDSLKALEQEFSDLFIRVHRNALVAKKHFAGLEKSADGVTRARLRGADDRVEVSRRHLPAVRKWLRGRGS